MDIDDYKNLEEVISKEDFQNLIKQLFENKKKFEADTIVEILEVLSDKYVKFYENILSCHQSDSLCDLLIQLTDFTNLKRIETLIGILFSFRIDTYYNYLVKQSNTIIYSPVKNEIMNSLLEYETLRNNFDDNIK